MSHIPMLWIMSKNLTYCHNPDNLASPKFINHNGNLTHQNNGQVTKSKLEKLLLVLSMRRFSFQEKMLFRLFCHSIQRLNPNNKLI